jgi:hypothetical protein
MICSCHALKIPVFPNGVQGLLRLKTHVFSYDLRRGKAPVDWRTPRRFAAISAALAFPPGLGLRQSSAALAWRQYRSLANREIFHSVWKNYVVENFSSAENSRFQLQFNLFSTNKSGLKLVHKASAQTDGFRAWMDESSLAFQVDACADRHLQAKLIEL